MAKAIYTNVPRQLSDLLKDVCSGRIGLPDLQRPFVCRVPAGTWPEKNMLQGYVLKLTGSGNVTMSHLNICYTGKNRQFLIGLNTL